MAMDPYGVGGGGMDDTEGGLMAPVARPDAPAADAPDNSVGLLGRIFGSPDPSTIDASGLTSAERRQPLWSGLTHAGLLAIAAGGSMYDRERAPLLAQMGAALGGIPEQLQKNKTAAAQRTLIAAQVPHLAAQTAQTVAATARAKTLDPMAIAKIKAEIVHLTAQGKNAEAEAAYHTAMAGKTELEQQQIRNAMNLPEVPSVVPPSGIPLPNPGGTPAPTPTPAPAPAPDPNALPPFTGVPGTGMPLPVPPPPEPKPGVNAPPDLKSTPQPLRLTPQTLAQQSDQQQQAGAPVQVPLTPEQRAIIQPPPPSVAPPAAATGMPKAAEREAGEPTFKSGPYTGMTVNQARDYRVMAGTSHTKAEEFRQKVVLDNASTSRAQWKEIGRSPDGSVIFTYNAADGEPKAIKVPQSDADAFREKIRLKEEEARIERESLKPKADSAVDQAARVGMVNEGIKEHGKRSSTADDARSGLATNQYLGELLENSYSGAGAGTRTDIVNAAKGWGMTTGMLAKFGVDDKSSASETARAVAQQSALQLRNPAGGAGMPGSLSDSDRKFLETSTAGLEMTPEGRRLMISMRNKLYERAILHHQMSLDHMRGGSFTGDPLGAQAAIAKYDKEHPIFDDQARDEIRAVAAKAAEASKPKGNIKTPTIIGVTPSGGG